MEAISKTIQVAIPAQKAFDRFVNKLGEWWPPEYTWSQDSLEDIRIDSQKNGLCTEIGPHGFRCDWGRVIELIENEKIELKWQISAKREPIPNPAKASNLRITFTDDGGSTTVQFEHFNFENHGEGAVEYRNMMDSEYGWPYILNKYKNYCEAE